jgi:FtsH-binding integral membrane protein
MVHVVSAYSVTLVMEALALTMAIFISLTLYTLLSKKDFSGMGPYLYAAVSAIVCASIIQFVAWAFTGHVSTVGNFLLSLFAASVFSLLIVYDTHNIFTRMSPEDYILGVLELYMDFIQLFRHVLRILSYLQGHR